MLFSQSELEELESEARASRLGSMRHNAGTPHHDSSEAQGEVHYLWSDGRSSSVFENDHGCLELIPIIN